MAEEAISGSEQHELGVLNPDVHDQWFWGEAEPTSPASSPATTSSPPSWWQQRAAAHELKHTQKQGQRNLL